MRGEESIFFCWGWGGSGGGDPEGGKSIEGGTGAESGTPEVAETMYDRRSAVRLKVEAN